jgi:hypothetical protein
MDHYVLFVSISKDYDQNGAEVEEGLNDYSSWAVANPCDAGGADPGWSTATLGIGALRRCISPRWASTASTVTPPRERLQLVPLHGSSFRRPG